MFLKRAEQKSVKRVRFDCWESARTTGWAFSFGEKMAVLIKTLQKDSSHPVQMFEAFPKSYADIIRKVGTRLKTAGRKKETVKFLSFVGNVAIFKETIKHI